MKNSHYPSQRKYLWDVLFEHLWKLAEKLISSLEQSQKVRDARPWTSQPLPCGIRCATSAASEPRSPAQTGLERRVSLSCCSSLSFKRAALQTRLCFYCLGAVASLEPFCDFSGSWHGLWPSCLHGLPLLPWLCSLLYSCTEFVAGLYSLCLILQFQTLKWSLTEIPQPQECRIRRVCDYCHVPSCHLWDACSTRVAPQVGTKRVQSGDRGERGVCCPSCASSSPGAQGTRFQFVPKGSAAGAAAPAAAARAGSWSVLSIHRTLQI